MCLAGIPKVYWYGKENGCNILVMELLDRNLESIKTKALSMMTILLVVD